MAVHETSESSPEGFIGMSEMNGLRSAGELDPSSPIIEGGMTRRTGDGVQHGAEDVEGVEFENGTTRDGSGIAGGDGDGQMSLANTTEVDEFHGVSEASRFSLLRELHELRVPSPLLSPSFSPPQQEVKRVVFTSSPMYSGPTHSDNPILYPALVFSVAFQLFFRTWESALICRKKSNVSRHSDIPPQQILISPPWWTRIISSHIPAIRCTTLKLNYLINNNYKNNKSSNSRLEKTPSKSKRLLRGIHNLSARPENSLDYELEIHMWLARIPGEFGWMCSSIRVIGYCWGFISGVARV
jgi:hypothetical protein